MDTFRSILAEVDPKLTEADLDQIIQEIDEDGSGTMDFEEFCELMMTSPDSSRFLRRLRRLQKSSIDPAGA